MTESATRPRQLTPKGRAARQKIIEAAAGLIYERGVAGTNNELVRKAAGISGSQLSHYFPDKESLVRAVLAWRADSMIGLHRDPPLGAVHKYDKRDNDHENDQHARHEIIIFTARHKEFIQ